jgi:hypothetical protein
MLERKDLMMVNDNGDGNEETRKEQTLFSSSLLFSQSLKKL